MRILDLDRDIQEIVFCAVYDYVEKADISKGDQNPKTKLEVAENFSEISKLKFGKKMPYILCILKRF